MPTPPGDGRSRARLGRVFLGHPRLLASVLAALVVGAVLPGWQQATRLLVAWNAGTMLYLVSTFVVMGRATPRTIRDRAAATDDGRFAVLVLVSIAGLASVGAIVAQLNVTKDLHGIDKGLHLGLAALTIVSAWAFLHLTYALHYAHEYFDEIGGRDGAELRLRGGVAFPGTDEPDYWDFLYFAFIIGVAAQTADVSITSKTIRRTSLAHSVLAFFFNSAILALTINIAAGLI